MRSSAALILTLLCGFTPLHAAPADVSTARLTWYDVLVQFRAGRRVNGFVEAGQRRSLYDGAMAQQLFRSGLIVPLSPVWRLTAGFAHFQHDAAPAETAFLKRPEWRLFQFFMTERSRGPWSGDLRIRTEQRWNQRSGGESAFTDGTFSARAGIRVRIRRVLNRPDRSTGAVFLEGAHETMLHRGPAIRSGPLDQVRFQTGAGWLAAPGVQVQGSLMYLRQNLSRPGSVLSAPVLRIQLQLAM